MIITIGTRKGGSGKSTLATNLAAMRKSRGHDVSLVDTDDQQSAAMWGATRAQNEEYSENYIPVLCVTGAGKGVAAAITAHATKYKDLVIDSPGKDSPELRAAQIASEVVVVPLRASQFDLWALEKDLDMIAEIRNMKDSIGAPFRVILVFNGIDTSPNVRNRQLNDISGYLEAVKDKIDACGAEICPAHISNRGVFNKASISGESVHEAGGKTPSDESAKIEMDRLYKFIFGDKK